MNHPCTLIEWRVKADAEPAFERTVEQLGDVLQRFPHRPGGVVVMRSIDDPTVFHTMGWFHREADLEAMRETAEARQLLDQLAELCDEFTPTQHHVVRTDAG